MRDDIRETDSSVFLGTWNYSMPKYTPNSDGDIVLIFRCCFGPAEWWQWGIDSNGKFFEQYQWCENDFYESDNYREEISEQKMLERIRSMEKLFRENGVTKYADAYKEAEEYVLKKSAKIKEERNWLGFKEIDKKRQENRKNNFLLSRKLRKWEMGLVIIIFGALGINTGRMGIKAIKDTEYVKPFLQSLGFLVGLLAICFGTVFFLEWLFNFVFMKQNTEKLPMQSNRSLRKILNQMNGSIPLIVWNVGWGCIVFTALIMGIGEHLMTIENIVTVGGNMLKVYLVGYVIFRFIHSRRNLTKRMLRYTKEVYNYGDGKVYAEYIDWSIREHLLLACKQYMLTDEFFLGYAYSDMGFAPIAIPREFIKNAEVRMAYTADSQMSTSKSILACQLYNGKVVDFYLSRFEGNQMAVDLLRKKGFQFTIRTDMVEYQ